jgi:hypothetical protein
VTNRRVLLQEPLHITVLLKPVGADQSSPRTARPQTNPLASHEKIRTYVDFDLHVGQKGGF